MKMFVNSKYKEGRGIIEQTGGFQSLVDQLTTIKIIIDDVASIIVAQFFV